MSDRQNWSRLVASIFALTIVSAFTFAAFAPKYYTSLFTAEATSVDQTSGPAVANLEPLTIGTCDTAGPIEVESSGGTTAPTAYATLKLAFDAIIAGTHTGTINIEVCGNTTETATAALTASGVGSASYTSVTIRPVGGARIIEGSIVGAIIKLDGADNVTVDGRQGGVGSARDLTVRNNNTSAATAAIWLASVAAGNGATNNVIRNLELAGGTDTSSSSNSTFGIIMCGTTISTTANGVDNDNNSFIGNRIIKVRYGIVTRGTTTDLNINPVVTDNIVGPSAFGTDQIGKVGILMQADTGALVSRNTVQFVGCLDPQACTGADRVGIGIGSESWSTSPGTLTSNTYTVTKNFVHDVVEEVTFSAVGINLGTTGGGSPTNNLVANNFIYNVRANGTSGDQAVGLGIAGGHTDRVVFNSISMTGDVDPGVAGASTNFGSGIRVGNPSGSTHANLTLMNNSVYMDLSSSSTAGNRYYAISGPSNVYSWGTGGENYNNYYINPANTQLQTGGLGTASGNTLTTQFATLANWQTAYTAAQDPNSIQADPQYVSTTADLHIAMASPNVNAGTTIAGVNDDIDGQLRNGVPDIGADEPAGITPPMNDVAAGSVLNPPNGSLVGAGAMFTPQASFTNIGTNNQTNITVRYRIINSMMVDVYNQTANISSLNSGATANASFPATSIASPGSYTVVASAELAGDQNTGNDSVGSSFTVVSPLNGSYNVGAGGDFTSLTNPGGIFDYLNSAGATGNITINITTNLLAESGTVALNEVAGGFSVTIKPSGAARTISGSNASSLIRVNGADNVTIDGSLTGGSATGIGGNAALRNLSIQNTNATATAGAVIAVTQGTNSANNVTIKNVNVSGQDPTQTLIGIHVGGNAVGSAPTVASNNNVVVDNCAFQKSFIGIFNDGVSPAVAATGNVISHNDLSATGANRMRRAGIFVFYHNGIQITENKIGGIVADEAADAIGIIAGIQNVTTTSTTSGGIYNSIIAKNLISGIASTNTTGFSAAGIAIAGDPLGENFIGNNMISGVVAPSTSPDIVAGVFVAGVASSNTHLFYNSISVTGDRGAVASQIGSYGVAISGTNPVVELKDNIFYNTQISGGGVNAKSYAIGMTSATFTNLSSNYNDFFTSGANAAGFRTGSLDTTGTDLANLAAWQAATSGDANSISADPLFVNPSTDLHIQTGSPAQNAGVVIGAILDDIDGNPRGTMPDIGADEIFVAVPGTLAFSSATYSVGEAGPTVTLTVNRTGGTDGAVNVDYALSGGTATGGASCGGAVDYVNAGGTVMFANGESSKTINVAICEDAVYEGDETFNATLSNATGGATIGSPNPATVTITDNETIPTVQFSSATYSTNEALSPEGGPGATINVTLSGASQSAVMVNYATVAGGTATGGASCSAGVDYINASGTLNIPAGNLGGNFFVATCADMVDEPDETVNLALTMPVGATLGAPNTAVLTIVDNDLPTGNVTVNPGAVSYMTLGDAVAAINAGTHTGAVTVDINANTTETGPIVLNSSGAGSASYTSLVIRPSVDGVTVAGPTVTGRGLLELNGADNVTIDGDNPNTGGINRNLTFQNTAANTVTFTSVIRIALAITVVNTADNDVVKNLNIVGSSTGRNINTATSTTASENTTFGILAGTGASTTDGTVAPAAITSVSTGVAAGATANNLTITNNNIVTAARAVSINGTATSVFPGLLINGNSIGNPVAGNVDQVTAIGITAQGSTNAIISGNTVWVEGYVASSAAGQGINVGVNSVNVTGATIEKNKVNRVRNNNPTTFTAAGINLGGGSSHIVQNNFISGVINDQTAGTGGFGSTFGTYGIRIVSGTGHKIYHNSVHLYGPMPGVTSTNATVGLVISSTTLTGIDVRNNIFSNQITGGSPTSTRHFAVMLPASGTSAMNLTINNNAYYVSPDPQARLANASTSLNAAAEYLVENFDPTQTTPATNWRAYTSPLSAAGTNDNASFASTAPPPFTSNTDLHIPAMTATRLESGGAAVGVTTDIDAEMRNATTPDIGADEFAGVPPAANDIAAVAFVVPANGSTITTGAMFTPQARFTNNGTATQTNVTVRFRIVNSAMVTVYNQTATIASIAPLQNIVVSFPATSIATPGSYTMTASSELAGDANPANDMINGAFTAVDPIGGTISVGTGQTYTSLTNPGGVFEALNLAGISGNVTVNITSDLTTETGAIFLNQLAESGAGGYTVTFKPSGAARTVSGTPPANTALITLNGADRIIFDGSLAGGTDRSLTFTDNQTGTTTVFWIRSQSASNGSTNNTIKNCIINGAPGPNSTTTAGILTGSGVTLGNDAEAANSNNTIQNNWIYRVQNAMYLRGGATAPVFDQNWTVVGNELGSSAVNDNNIFRGMLIGNSQNFTISGNTIHGIRSTTTTTASMSGIQIALLVNGGMVTNNVIENIKNVSATGTGANAISFISTSTTSNVTVANNFIFDVAANGSATLASNGFGINVASGGGYKIYHNSINLNTNQTSGTTAAMLVQSTVTAAGALDIRNNIFANTQTAGATRYAFYSGAANTVYTPIDYNDYFSTGSVGFLGSARATLADWQTATGQDANSKAVDPLFVSATNLHIQLASTMINMGGAGTGITTDIDGQMRDGMPDIGADEVPPVAMPGTLQFSSPTYSIGESGGTATVTVTRTSGTDGAVTVDYATVAGGTATGGASCTAGIDYINASGTLMFANGDSSKTFNVTICNDAVNEPSETVNMALSNATGGATIGSPSTAVLTITDDDLPPGSLSINDVRMFEGNSGSKNFVFTVSYNGPTVPVSVQYATANGTATAGVDYLAASGTVTFNSLTGPEGLPAPQTATITVVVNGETVKEANETFFVNLSSPTGATISDGQGVGIIIDEDRAYVADFDLDRVADFSVFRPSENRWYVLQSTTLTPKIVDFGATGDIAVPGDYDGDGIADMALFRPSTGQWYRILSTNGSTQITSWGSNGDKPVQGDYDGDGKTDLAVFRPSTGTWWILRSSNGSSASVPFGISTDRPVQGDYDGDAKTDIAVYRDGIWYILRSSDGAVQTGSFGIASDKPVSGDFDGDGKYDLAIYRGGVWWVLRSLTGTAVAVPWGAAADIPVPADYDADGTTDFAVFRPSTGDWLVIRSSNSTSFGVHWGVNGDVPIPAAYLPQ